MSDDDKPGFDRRTFLRGTAGGAAVTGILTLSSKAAAAKAPPVIGPNGAAIKLHVNGAVREVKVEPRTTLVHALRDQLKLTGTKVGCDRGACGACTVHLDGAPALACSTLAIEVGDRKITTIEGLANGETLHPVQQAFIEQDAMQCGFCTPGMVMSCAALLAIKPKPARNEIRQAVSGNLCRCGTYPKVFTAVMTASGQPAEGWTLETRNVGDGNPPPAGKVWVGIAGGALTAEERPVPANEVGPWPTNVGLNIVGKPAPRMDGRAKVTGAARYTSDIQLPKMLHAKRVVSPHAHALVKRVDTRKAERLAGVKAVFVVKVQEGATLVDPSTENNGKFPRIRYAGQCVAAVAATTPEIAEEAARLIEVDYDVLPAATTIADALAPNAPLVYPGPVNLGGTAGGGGAAKGLPQKGNVRGPTEQVNGNVDEAMAKAPIKITGKFETQVQTHSAMETHGIVADWKPDGLTVYASTQGTATVREELATVFKLPKPKVRVVSEYMGGGFGAKFGAGHFGVVAVELSRRAKAPVRMMLDRREEHTAVGNRPNTLQEITIGANADGSLAALDLVSHGSSGIATGAGVGWAAMRMYPAVAQRTRQHDVFMHTGPGAAFRAPGMPQGVFALETVIEELAEKLKVDSLDLRDRLDIDKPGGGITDVDRIARKLERRIGAEKIGWAKRGAPGAGKGPIKYGIGVAQSMWRRFADMNSACEVKAFKDGSVQVRSSVMDIGTGTRTVLAMLVAEDLGIKATDVTVDIGDTRWPIGPSSGGSKTLVGITPAVRQAVHEVKQKLKFDQHKSFKAACAAMTVDEISAIASRPADWNGPKADGYGGVQFAAVQVDVETGVVRVLKMVAVQECGRLINPLAVQSQINGGIIHGISYALFEDRKIDQPTGRMLNANLDQYKVVGARDTPFIEIVLLDQYVGLTNTDAHGIGEPANVATAAAVANAVYNAIGVRIRELPITPKVVLAALGKSGKVARS
jgi:xanthine dehydrogenase YagR molybdenum-binding subunit